MRQEQSETGGCKLASTRLAFFVFSVFSLGLGAEFAPTLNILANLGKRQNVQSPWKNNIMTGVLNSFDYNIETGENYEHSLFAIVNFANQTGMALQHVGFDEFRAAMNSDEIFVLER